MKGKTAKEASEEAEELLRKLNMYEKKNDLAHTLSGGMKRKLCLGMAVIGNSSVSGSIILYFFNNVYKQMLSLLTFVISKFHIKR